MCIYIYICIYTYIYTYLYIYVRLLYAKSELSAISRNMCFGECVYIVMNAYNIAYVSVCFSYVPMCIYYIYILTCKLFVGVSQLTAGPSYES